MEGFDPTVKGAGYYEVGDFFGSFKEETLSVFAPITSDYKVRAYVVAHMPMRSIEMRCDSFMNFCYILLIVLLLLSIIILIFFTEMVYVPLRRITEATEQYAAGNMDYKISADSESDDEIGYLAATVSYMAGEIARAEDDQKKFIANVSHDFRSPLTSIRGYLEAMKDGTIPEENHGKYLDIVLNETDRLYKLTNGLLTLNNLNSKGMMLDKTDFDINRVIRDTAASFEGVCRNRGISFDLVMTEEIMLVHADMERIRQVLYNLVDNAIKFSHDGDAVTVETTEQHGKVFVSVKDTGIGIPKEDLKMVFERFYKGDSAHNRNISGTGLGLSIAKSLVLALEGQIEAFNAENGGAEIKISI